eukprot:TRINITY_DN328_c0_g1_i2.p1 TRINITY_DN328_c0_g1~~TRINITY_DN328_c0_g1_i2.p1  ORF type:complete len:451 (-),score=52.33 TRINITY_DN328_c0_g1_i2:175-1527(-)
MQSGVRKKEQQQESALFRSKIPISDPKPRTKLPGTHSTSSRFNDKGQGVKLERLPAIFKYPSSQWLDIFLFKIRQCQSVFNFKDPLSDAASKDVKREALQDIISYLKATNHPFNTEVYEAIFKMFELNLFRPLPPKEKYIDGIFDPEDEDETYEEAWLHLQYVYEFFLLFLGLPMFDREVAKQFVTPPFVLKILELFDSEDPRERNQLKMVLHKLYSRFVQMRGHIRKHISHILLIFVYDTERHNGIAELLEILGSIVNGFQTPLKEEHRTFLFKAIMPLHSSKNVIQFHKQLMYCINEYLTKDESLAAEILHQLIRYWPTYGTNKQLAFMFEMGELLATVNLSRLEKCKDLLFKRLGTCMESPHFQISEKAMDIFYNNVAFRRFFNMHVATQLSYFYEVLKRVSTNHWHRNTRILAEIVLSKLKEVTPSLYASAEEEYLCSLAVRNGTD